MNAITPERLARSGTEDGNQSALFCWCANNINVYPDLRWLFAIPNGGWRDPVTANKLKATGVKSGVFDLCLLVRRGQYPALWIEMKKPANKTKAGIVAKNQKPWHAQALSQGHGVAVCYGWIEARDILIQYLEWK